MNKKKQKNRNKTNILFEAFEKVMMLVVIYVFSHSHLILFFAVETGDSSFIYYSSRVSIDDIYTTRGIFIFYCFAY